MSDLHDRFERLARRGTYRGGDAVLDAARRRAEDSGALESVEGAAPTNGGAPEIVSLLNLEPSTTDRRRRRLGSVVAAGGVAASLFVGMLAIGSLVGSGGGANSPEGAVRQLADAVAHEDSLAAVDVLEPNEVRSLRATIDAASRRAQELALAETATAPLTGLDVSIDDLNLSTESLGNGFAKVTVVGGTISSRIDRGQFSPLMQRVLRDSKGNTAQADLESLVGSDVPTSVMTVQHDGHWYVSAAYTALEIVRELNHLPAADLGSGLRATATLGADNPDTAVSDAMQALAHNDWQKLISLSPPDQLPVYDYRAALVQLAAETKTKFTIDEVATTSTVNGDTAKVVLKASGKTDSGTWSFDGSCYRQSDEYSSSIITGSESIVGNVGGPGLSICAGSSFILPWAAAKPENGAPEQITVVRESGRWFISPAGTVLDLADKIIDGLTRRTLYTMLNVPDQLPPDGALTLGRPVTLSRSDYGAFVYTLDGRQGERLLGTATTKPAYDDYGFMTEVRVFAPDGNELDNAYGLLAGESVQLPADGTYKVVIQAFYGSEVTVTIWDEAQAPEAAKHPQFPAGLTGNCTYTVVGETCSKSGGPVISTATSVPVATTVPGG